MVKVLHPALYHAQTERQHTATEGLEDRNSWKPLTAIHSYPVHPCDVLALRSTCKNHAEISRRVSITPLLQSNGMATSTASLWTKKNTDCVCRLSFFCFIKYKIGRGRGRPCPGFQSTWHCEYVAGTLSYHTAPWYFITSHDAMFKLNSTCRDTGAEGFKASKSPLSTGLSSTAAHYSQSHLDLYAICVT